MSVDPLATALRRAEDIARQFPHLSPEGAAERVRGHIASFWSPDMRRDLAAAVAQRQAPPVVAAAVQALAPRDDGAAEVETVDLTDADGTGGLDEGALAADTGEA